MIDSIGKSPARNSAAAACDIDRYTTAWRLGTGLPIAVEPGTYNITDSLRVDGVRYVTLDGRYRIAASRCRSA